MAGVEGLKGVFPRRERAVASGGDEAARYGGGGADGRMARESHERVEWRIDLRLLRVLGWGADTETSVFGARSSALAAEQRYAVEAGPWRT